MRHRKIGKSLGRKTGPRQAMFRNLASSIVLYEKVKTTEAKAKSVKPLLEKYITKSKNNNLHTRRELLKFFYDEKAVNKLLEDIGPRYQSRMGGYLRITKLGFRQGDAAPMVNIELV